jgi:phospho-N-acetylmuramoyl-pentapeptide-transferase
MQTSMVFGLAGLSFVMAVIWGPPLIRVLRHFKVGEAIRVDGPERHFTKLGTPTMGGVMIVLPVVFLTLLLNAGSLVGINVLGRSVLLPMIAMVAFCLF